MVITVFGSGRCTPDSPEYAQAHSLGTLLAQEGFEVCNGGYAGIMEATAKGARSNGGKTIGVTLESFSQKPNPWISRELRMPDLTERLKTLIATGDGFVVLRGGTGTLLELSAVWEFLHKGFMNRKPLVFLGPFWTPLIRMMRDELMAEGTSGADIPLETATPADCIQALRTTLR